MTTLLSRQYRKPSVTLVNQFFPGGALLPHAVVALNSPTLGTYERRMISRMMLQHAAASANDAVVGVRVRKPLLLCADGAYSKLMLPDGSGSINGSAQPDLLPFIDFVVGDYDSLHPSHRHPITQADQTVSLVNDFELRVADEHRRQHPQRPFFLKVRDQDTTDFEKCMQLCEKLLLATSSSSPSSSDHERQTVVVLGSHGGEWHHEIAALHVAAKYSGSLLDVRLHSPFSTVLFCLPNGTTQFIRNEVHETTGFSLIPFGRTPDVCHTKGLQWNVDWKNNATSSSSSGAVFGFGNASVGKAFLSTSNRIVDPAGAVEVECRCPPDSVIAMSITCKKALRIESESLDKAKAAQDDQLPRVGVSVLVQRRDVANINKYLVVQRGKSPALGMWAFPGGSVKYKEATVDAARRELLEETNLGPPMVSLYPTALQTLDVIPDCTSRPHFVLVQHAGVICSSTAARTPVETVARAQDDAEALDWWTLEQIVAAEKAKKAVNGLSESIRKFEHQQRVHDEEGKRATATVCGISKL